MHLRSTARRNFPLIAAVAITCLGASLAMGEPNNTASANDGPKAPTIQIDDPANGLVHEAQLVPTPNDRDRDANTWAAYDVAGQSTMHKRGRTVGAANFAFQSVAPAPGQLIQLNRSDLLAISPTGIIVLIEQRHDDRPDWMSYDFTILNGGSEPFRVSVHGDWPMSSATRPDVIRSVLLLHPGASSQRGDDPPAQNCSPTFTQCNENAQAACNPLHHQVDYSCDPETGKVTCSWTCTDSSDL